VFKVIPGSKEVPGGAASAAEALEHMELGLDDLEGAVEALKGSIGSIEEEASAVARAGAEVNAHARRMTEELMRNASAAREAMEVMERALKIGTAVQDDAQRSRGMLDETNRAVMAMVSSAQGVADSIQRMTKVLQDISEITGHITAIAKQTKLLSLNASIEAERAGEHGKGFGVVAAEVRKLAQRTDEAASKISQLASSSRAIGDEASSSIAQAVGLSTQASERTQATMEALETMFQSILTVAEALRSGAKTASQQSRSASELAEMSQAMAQRTDEQASMLTTVDGKVKENRIVMDLLPQRILDSSRHLESLKGALCGDDHGEPSVASIRQRGEVLMGIEIDDFGKFHWWEGRIPKGLDVDLGEAIARELAVPARWVAIPWGNGERGTVTGTWTLGDFDGFHFLCTTVTKLPERLRHVTFSRCYFKSGQSVVVPRASGIRAIGDLKGRRVAVTSGSTSEAAARRHLKESKIVPFPTGVQEANALANGEVDAMVLDRPVAWDHLERHPEWTELGISLSVESFAVTMPKGTSPALKALIDQVVIRERDRLFSKYFANRVRR